MKLIITSAGNSLQSKFDVRFGRSEWFCLWDTDDCTFRFIENLNKNLNGGAGTKAAETVAELNAEKVISGDFGPKAKSLLKQFNIQMMVYDTPDHILEEVVESIKFKI